MNLSRSRLGGCLLVYLANIQQKKLNYQIFLEKKGCAYAKDNANAKCCAVVTRGLHNHSIRLEDDTASPGSRWVTPYAGED